MRSIFLHILVGVCFIFISSSAWASDPVRLNSYFTYATNRSDIQEQLGANREELEKLDVFIQEALGNKQLTIKRIRLYGYTSSGESQTAIDRRLESERIWWFRGYIVGRYSILNRYPMDVVWAREGKRVKNNLKHIEIVIDFEPVDPALLPVVAPNEELVMDTLTVNKEIVLDPLIYNVLDRKDVIQIPKREFSGIYPWEVKKPEKRKTTIPKPEPTSYISYTAYYIPRWAVRTNLLLWAGIMTDAKRTTYTPNVSLEYYITDRWAVEAGVEYSHWRYDNGNRFQGLSGYRLEPRYWFNLRNEKYFMYAGIYGRMGEYTNTHAATKTTGHTGRYWDAGLSAGLYLHLTKNWGVELAARAGYVDTKATLYTVDDGHRYLDGYQLYNKMRITGLMLNFVYRWR